MKVRVLGCHGGETPKHRTTCFLIDDRVTIDAGAVCRTLDLDAQVAIDHMLISHSHMDHVKDLALMADQVIGRRPEPVHLYCGPETAETLRSSYFNNYLWPDFTCIPTPDAPTMVIDEREAEQSFLIPPKGEVFTPEMVADAAFFERGGLEVTYVLVSHPVESMAMLITGANGTLVYSSDTGPTDRLWELVNGLENVRGVFVELSFPNHMQALADVAGHYTPNTLAQDVAKLNKTVPLFVYHLKPSFFDATRDEFYALGLSNARLVELDDTFEF